ncbi:hypothetical protein BB987_09335 [Photorhabdus temperata]|uniref:Uncharacterized protein n=1 Tax=Photorhabdus khanii NC19 TaxID=1004151 RepID=W3V5P8_9GAMM|nr:hypothetical protein [Photorhabdus khanii]ETS31103.1 hypothetical protein PTE_03055 [Photorhabdus khanii NC19]OHV54909.1 hypothetical protein BB987_09335 [Photorhabdus temperata]
MAAHVHAEKMLQYAQDALKTDKPWKLWEIGDGADGWDDLDDHPWWIKDSKYRRKPEMITIGKVSFPKPVDYELKAGQEYWYVNSLLGVCYNAWRGSYDDNSLLKNGLVHLTEEAAKQYHKALIKINKGEF